MLRIVNSYKEKSCGSSRTLAQCLQEGHICAFRANSGRNALGSRIWSRWRSRVRGPSLISCVGGDAVADCAGGLEPNSGWEPGRSGGGGGEGWAGGPKPGTVGFAPDFGAPSLNVFVAGMLGRFDGGLFRFYLALCGGGQGSSQRDAEGWWRRRTRRRMRRKCCGRFFA
jgi:hypothetical protein